MANVMWSKGESIDKLMQELTVGSDPIFDREMAQWDCMGSAAHARMLHSLGMLSDTELAALLKELKKIETLGRENKIEIPIELEDVHNVIETLLVKSIGDAGLRIHAGRSRNDQILVTMRLFLRNQLVVWLAALTEFAQICLERYDQLKDVLMPGYTHMQPAMPSSVGMWLHSLLENSLEILKEGLSTLELVNANPLGASAGFGSNIPLNRDLTTELLGFARVQRSPIDCNNSRGRYEEKVLRVGMDIASLFEKMACDMMLYTTREYGFFSLPVELTTGSSIMPQKRNCDIIELLRARTAKIRGAANELTWITAKLTSSYNRDFQYTKEPFIRAAHELTAMFKMANLILSRFSVNKERLAQAMYPDLYATYEANRAAVSGIPYRNAYKMVAEKLRSENYDKKQFEKDVHVVLEQTDKYVREAKEEFAALKQTLDETAEKLKNAQAKVFEV